MYFRAVAGLIAGVVGGVVSAALFLVVNLPNLQGEQVPLLTVISRAIGFNDAGSGWSFHLFVSAVVGMLFGVLIGGRTFARVPLFLSGLGTGLLLWLLAALVILPVMLGFSPFAPLTVPALAPVFWQTLVGSLIYGICLPVAFYLLYRPVYEDEQNDRRSAQAQDRSQRLSRTGGAAQPRR